MSALAFRKTILVKSDGYPYACIRVLIESKGNYDEISTTPMIMSIEATHCRDRRQHATRTRRYARTIYFCPMLRVFSGWCRGCRYGPIRGWPAIECSITNGAILDPGHIHLVGDRVTLVPGSVSSLSSKRRCR